MSDGDMVPSRHVVQLFGGPMDGVMYDFPDEIPIMVVTQPLDMPAMMMGVDPSEPTTEDFASSQHAYLRDVRAPWRFVYQGERQR